MNSKRCDCLFPIVISIIIGVLIGYVYSLGLITEIITAVGIALGISVISLILLVTLIIFSRKEMDKCICINGKCLILGIFSTLILSTIALSITLMVDVGIAILIGLLGGFLILLLISMSKLICCLINSKCRCREE